jgi:hypothetical protein
LTFLGLFAMFSLSPLTLYASGWLADVPASWKPGSSPERSASAPSAACPLHPQTSYWQSDANEMVAIKTFLIIVNSLAR